jgi:hypothetical protein
MSQEVICYVICKIVYYTILYILSEVFVVSLSPSKQIPEQYLKLGHDHLLSHCFQFIIQCYLVWTIVKALQNKLQTVILYM